MNLSMVQRNGSAGLQDRGPHLKKCLLARLGPMFTNKAAYFSTPQSSHREGAADLSIAAWRDEHALKFRGTDSSGTENTSEARSATLWLHLLQDELRPNAEGSQKPGQDRPILTDSARTSCFRLRTDSNSADNRATSHTYKSILVEQVMRSSLARNISHGGMYATDLRGLVQ